MLTRPCPVPPHPSLGTPLPDLSLSPSQVTYLRTASPADAADAAPMPSGRRTASRAPIPFNNEHGPQVSYSCVDYSCGDWFSDMCQSVFRGGATAHQSLHDDPNDLMNVDP